MLKQVLCLGCICSNEMINYVSMHCQNDTNTLQVYAILNLVIIGGAQMKKKSILMAMCMLLVGCAPESIVTEVENFGTQVESSSLQAYSENDKDENAENSFTYETEGYSTLNGIEWKEEMRLTNSNGENLLVKFDLTTKSEYERDELTIRQMQVVDYTNKEEKKKLVEAVFGGEDVYRFEDRYKPKFIIQSYIDDNRKIVDVLKENNRQDESNYYESLIKEYMVLLKSAPEELIPISDYNGNKYFGMINEVPYVLTFLCGWDKPSYTVGGTDYYDVKNGFTLEKCEISYYNRDKEVEFATEEVGREIADSWIDRLGFEKTRYLDTNMDVNNTKLFTINYSQGYNAIIANINNEGMDSNFNTTGFDSKIHFAIENNELKQLIVNNHVKMISESSDIAILSFTTVQEIVKYYIQKGIDYVRKDTGVYNLIELTYMNCFDKDYHTYYQIPIWRIHGSGGTATEMKLNAIDGTPVVGYEV